MTSLPWIRGIISLGSVAVFTEALRVQAGDKVETPAASAMLRSQTDDFHLGLALHLWLSSFALFEILEACFWLL
jgi:hypothetical protein